LSTEDRGGGRAPKAAALLVAAILLCAAWSPPAFSGTFRDAVGREVEVPARPARIVSLAPNLTEILFALGLEKEVAGVTLFCDWPREALDKPKIGGFINPSLEAILALSPDLVLATADGNRVEDVARLEALGLAVFTIDTRSVAEITDSILVVGRLTGTGDRARELADRIGSRLLLVAESLRGRPALPVFVALDRNPLITAAAGTFVDELVTLAGGRNVVDSPTVKYPVFSMEQLLVADPAVIVAAIGSPAEGAEAAVRWHSLPGGSSLRAVKEGKVYELGEGDFFRPGPRIIDSIERLAAILHPEVFGS
jgi:iron complex transport system substrate-binding protein